ncbi:hypothetical protein CBI31_00085 [Polynucleobacter campilacus]|uniref:Glycosyl transferase family 1 domain-containing protein n=2 Tax=Polynucleobacter campilacus TaxID=1743163 RepID=A0A254PVV3_9BURK|nr:hypothetical protein CBI31_00085 [Polynucleobacter campilacus]
MIYSIGFFSIIILIISKIANIKTYYYCHEPGDFKYYNFRNSWFKSIILLSLNYILIKICKEVVIPNKNYKSLYGKTTLYCPLQSNIVDFVSVINGSKVYDIGYLGTISKERGLSSSNFLSYSIGVLSNQKFNYKLPSNVEILSQLKFSDAKKNHFLKSCSVIFNLRDQPYNQSGVTMECLMSGVPVLTTTFDYYVSTYFSDLLPQILPAEINNISDEIIKQLVEMDSELKIQIALRAKSIFYNYPSNFFINLLENN